jgi:hypothetical protein
VSANLKSERQVFVIELQIEVGWGVVCGFGQKTLQVDYETDGFVSV